MDEKFYYLLFVFYLKNRNFAIEINYKNEK